MFSEAVEFFSSQDNKIFGNIAEELGISFNFNRRIYRHMKKASGLCVYTV